MCAELHIAPDHTCPYHRRRVARKAALRPANRLRAKNCNLNAVSPPVLQPNARNIPPIVSIAAK